MTAEKRSSALPDIPTMAEQGITGQEAYTLTGILAPAGTPKEIVTLLDIDMGEIVNNEEYFQEWQNMSNMKDMSAAMEMMSKIPGLKIETKERVEISFR